MGKATRSIVVFLDEGSMRNWGMMMDQ